MLIAPGDADDGDAAQQTEDHVQDGDLPETEQDPDEVHRRGQAARLGGPEHQLMTEGPERVRAQFEELHAERDADDEHAHQQPYDIVDQRDDQSAEDQPKDISEEFHVVT